MFVCRPTSRVVKREDVEKSRVALMASSARRTEGANTRKREFLARWKLLLSFACIINLSEEFPACFVFNYDESPPPRGRIFHGVPNANSKPGDFFFRSPAFLSPNFYNIINIPG